MTYKNLIVSTSFVILTSVSSSCFHSSNGEEGEIIIPAPEVLPGEIDEMIDSDAQQEQLGNTGNYPAPHIQEDIPLDMNEKVHRWIEYFTEKNRDGFQRYINRGAKYKKLITHLMTEQNIPPEMFYLSMIESGFRVNAKSHASAVGLWQFMSATGRRYGLKVDKYADERLDPHRSTIAAAMYLNDLHNVFDSWYLAMAAYNAGERRIMNAIMSGKTRNFWELVELKKLPPETMNYIPKFIAAATIGQNLEKYGFKDVPDDDYLFESVPVNIPSPISFSNISKYTSTPISTIKSHNPHLKRGMTPPSKKHYKVWLPKKYKAQVNDKYEKLAKLRMNIKPSYYYAGDRKYHRVRRGDTIASISRKYRISQK